ncbi:MAG: amidohydrolase family protein [Pseudomonadales bacterium]|jgi:5-methylthioadenosine/S-adenosylhomocysteine deaminase
MTATAITNARIYTVDQSFTVHANGTLVFDETGISAIGDTRSTPIPADAKVIDGLGRIAVLPGLIDVHSHSSLLKGFSENAQLMQWLPMYQREHQVITDEDVWYACMVSYLEALKGGTCTVMDMYRRLHQAADVATRLGNRVTLVPYAADHASKRFFDSLEDNCNLVERFDNAQNGRIRAWFGLEHITYCSADMFREAARLAEHYKTGIHTHSSEQIEEVRAVESLFGKRPIHLFEDYGIMRPGTVIAHCVWLSDEEVDVIARTGAGIAHCPTSNLKLACGIAELDRFLSAGIPVGLGSDGGISNNSLSMFECMKNASLLQKVRTLDAAIVPARLALELATCRGAAVLGLEEKIGSLEIGKEADVITVDLWQPHMMPIVESEGHDPVMWNLVFSARASDVRDVWVQGRHVVNQGKVTTVDEDALLFEIHEQTKRLLKRREATREVDMLGTDSA